MSEPAASPATPPDMAAKPWLDMLDESKKYFQTYNDKCDNVDKLHGDLKTLAAGGDDREFQIFWANMEVMKPRVYSRPPIPVVMPVFRDRRPLPRAAAEFLERALVSAVRVGKIHEALTLARDDLTVNARGVVWPRYVKDDDGERVCYDHLDRADYLEEPARKQAEVGWKARRDWLTRDQMRVRFEQISGDAWRSAEFKERRSEGTKDGGTTDEARGDPKAAVWQVWHRNKKLVAWVTDGAERCLDCRPPFLNLEGFFPCPPPAYATLQRRTLIPIPDFLYYKDQVEEINELTARISSLSESLRLKGFYPGGAGELAESIEAVLKDNDNRATLVAVSGFAALGGATLQQSIVWLPVREVAEVIKYLVELRRQLIEDVYQITGLSDILRGETDPNETLGAQELKAQTGSGRMKLKQEEMVRLALDAIRIGAEIMAENFAPETLAMQAQSELPTEQAVQQQAMQKTAEIDNMIAQAQRDPRVMQIVQQKPALAQQALAKANQQKQQIQQQASETITLEKVTGMLRDQRLRPFVLDIETDSTIQPDEDAEKQRRTEFVTAVGGFLGEALPLVQAFPQAGAFVAGTLKYLASGFRAGRELESTIDDFADQIEQAAQQPKPPDPETVKAEADAKAKTAEMQMKQQQGQADLTMRQSEMQMRETELRAELTKAQQEMQAAGQKSQAELVKLAAEIQKIFAEIERIDAQTKAAKERPEPAQEAA